MLKLSTARKMFPKDWEFIEDLTSGTQKAVFRVNTPDGTYCLKVLPGYMTGQGRFLQEVSILSRVKHKNIAKISDSGSKTWNNCDHAYFLEEFVPGHTLEMPDDEEQLWSLEYTCSVMASICDGISELVHSGVTHRDLKPSNIRMRHAMEPVIVDFGSAMVTGGLVLTSPGENPQGTLLYMSPDQIRGRDHIGPRTDLFAVGVMSYQGLTGRHPFFSAGMSDLQVKAAILDSTDYLEDPAFLNVRKSLRLLVASLLSKDWRNRPTAPATAARFREINKYVNDHKPSTTMSEADSISHFITVITGFMLGLKTLKDSELLDLKRAKEPYTDDFVKLIEAVFGSMSQLDMRMTFNEVVFVLPAKFRQLIGYGPTFLSGLRKRVGEQRFKLMQAIGLMFVGFHWDKRERFIERLPEIPWLNESLLDIAVEAGREAYPSQSALETFTTAEILRYIADCIEEGEGRIKSIPAMLFQKLFGPDLEPLGNQLAEAFSGPGEAGFYLKREIFNEGRTN